MISTRNYFLQRAVIISLMAIVVGAWLMAANNRNSGLFVFLVIAIALYGNHLNKKAGLGKGVFKISRDGYPGGLKHGDEREAKNASVASFYSARITLTFVMTVMGVIAVFLNGNQFDVFGYTANSAVIFSSAGFAIFGSLTVLIQQWTFYFVYRHLE